MASPILTLTVTKDGDQTATNVTVAGGGLFTKITETIAIGTDTQVNCAIDVSELTMIYIVASTDMTLEANSGSAADYTLTLTANKPLVWYAGCGITNPITDDTTKFYVTNAAEGTLTIYVDQDPTP